MLFKSNGRRRPPCQSCTRRSRCRGGCPPALQEPAETAAAEHQAQAAATGRQQDCNQQGESMTSSCSTGSSAPARLGCWGRPWTGSCRGGGPPESCCTRLRRGKKSMELVQRVVRGRSVAGTLSTGSHQVPSGDAVSKAHPAQLHLRLKSATCGGSKEAASRQTCTQATSVGTQEPLFLCVGRRHLDAPAGRDEQVGALNIWCTTWQESAWLTFCCRRQEFVPRISCRCMDTVTSPQPMRASSPPAHPCG